MASHRLLSVAGVLLALAGAAPVQGQVPLSPRALGMSGAVVGIARGHDALFVNPANLALPGSPTWSVAVPQVTLAGTLAGPELSDLPDLRTYATISEREARDIFGRIPEAGAEARFDLRAPLLAVQRRRLAFGVSYGALGEQHVSKDFFELALFGYERGRVDYEAAGTGGYLMTFWDFALAYGDRAGQVSWGVAAHYLRGQTLLRSRATEPRFDLAATDFFTDYVSVFLQGGNGFAIDIGAAYQPHRTLTLSGALANVFAGMWWSDDLYIRHLELDRTSRGTDFLVLHADYKRSERRVGPADAALVGDMTAQTVQEGAYLPTSARLGVAWQALPATHLGLSYYGNLTDGLLAGAWDQMLGIGVQQQVFPLLSLRAGYATNFAQGSMLSGGVTLGALELGIARLDDGHFDVVERAGWIGAIGLNIRTRTVMP